MNPVPTAAVTAAAAAASALTAITRRGADPEMPLGGYLLVMNQVSDSITTLSHALGVETRLASRVLLPEPGMPPDTDKADDVRARLRSAARYAAAGAESARSTRREIHRAWRAGRTLNDTEDPGSNGPLVRLARQAAQRVVEFDDELTAAAHQPVPAPIPRDLLIAHSEITASLTLILSQLGLICNQIAPALWDACERQGPQAARLANRVTNPLHQAGPDLTRAQGSVNHAHHVLDDAAIRTRKVVPGSVIK